MTTGFGNNADEELTDFLRQLLELVQAERLHIRRGVDGFQYIFSQSLFVFHILNKLLILVA